MVSRISRIAAACGAVALVAGVAIAAEKTPQQLATEARQGLMDLIVWEAGPLFEMAKGDIDYDAELATAKAENLAALSRYAGESLFLPESSTEELGDATRALPAIWEREEDFHAAFDDLREKAEDVVANADKGQDELRAAVAKLGNSCGNCHESFRLKD